MDLLVRFLPRPPGQQEVFGYVPARVAPRRKRFADPSRPVAQADIAVLTRRIGELDKAPVLARDDEPGPAALVHLPHHSSSKLVRSAGRFGAGRAAGLASARAGTGLFHAASTADSRRPGRAVGRRRERAHAGPAHPPGSRARAGLVSRRHARGGARPDAESAAANDGCHDERLAELEHAKHLLWNGPRTKRKRRSPGWRRRSRSNSTTPRASAGPG